MNTESIDFLRCSGIRAAASLAMGCRLNALYEICGKQRTVSTSVLMEELLKLHDGLRDDARLMRDLTRYLQGE